jgi:hypothetical protein
MKRKDLSSKSKEELIDIIEQFYNSPYVDIYFSIKKQVKKLSSEIEKTTIDFKEDSAPFKNFMQWGKESLNLANNLQEILSKIDSDILVEEQKKRASAGEGTVEDYIGRK